MIFLGTGASEGIPDPFCNCEVCRKARESGDPREIRGRSAFSIDRFNLIDFGPDAHLASARFGIPLYELRNLFYTHFHSDHFDLINWESVRMSLTPPHINVFLSEPAYKGMQEYLNLLSAHYPDRKRDLLFYNEYIRMIPVKPFVPFTADDMTVTALRTIHEGAFEGETAINYLFERNGKRFLYAADTGLYDEDNYSCLRGKVLNTLIMECSFGNAQKQAGFKHLTCEFIVQMVERFRKDGVVNDRTEIYLTHIGHKGGLNHLELQQKMRDALGMQVEVAYDGLRIADF